LFPLRNADITAAIGLCLEKLTKKELETTKDILNSILQGVSCEFSPIYITNVRI
jgi:telomere length regulation protein